MKGRFAAGLAVLALICFFGSALDAQLNRASITGTVVDSSGALVADGEVTVTEIATGEVNRARTNNVGIYSILNLTPGKCSLRFAKEGFTPINIPQITLQSTQVAKFDETLQVGAVTQAVEVKVEAPMLKAETADIGNNISGETMTDLPLTVAGGGRFFEYFARATMPGYAPNSDPYTTIDRKSTRLNSSHLVISYAVFCLKKKTHPDPAQSLFHVSFCKVPDCSY